VDVDPYIRDRARATRGGGKQGAPASEKETSEEYWLDMEGLEHRDTVTYSNLPRGTFFDTGMVHVLTTATLERLHEFYREGFLRLQGSDQTLWSGRQTVLTASWRIRGWAEPSRSASAST
jgi:hypothetical protein